MSVSNQANTGERPNDDEKFHEPLRLVWITVSVLGDECEVKTLKGVREGNVSRCFEWIHAL